MKKKFVFYRQLNTMDCGVTCLRMVAKYFGRSFNATYLKDLSGFNKEGISLLGLSDAAEAVGFRARGVRLTFKQLVKDAPLPCILHWEQKHYVVCLSGKISPRKRGKVTIADPASGIRILAKDEFDAKWISSFSATDESRGTALLLEPTYKFFEQPDVKSEGLKWNHLLHYFKGNKWRLTQVIMALMLTSFLQLIFPFLTQSVVDNGINNQDITYITIVLAAQLMLIFSKTIIDFIRNRIMLGISKRINFFLLSDFWIKLSRLPISYFDRYYIGDTLQRLNDAKRIESFLTANTLNTLFSIFTFFVFGITLALFNSYIFYLFLGGSVIYAFWIRVFLPVRKKINYQLFTYAAKENDLSLEMIQGMRDLKLNKGEHLKRWAWENTQASTFKLSFRNLNNSQLQQAGAVIINEGKNIAITFLAAKMVIDGNLTLGSLLAIQYIIGQLNGPVEQFVSFVQLLQDTKISMERLNQIHELKEEENDAVRKDALTVHASFSGTPKSIVIENLTFKYPGSGDMPVLRDINLTIPESKTTAIVGTSGSGKSTLLKLLLKFYDSYTGSISLQNISDYGDKGMGLSLHSVSASEWRDQCGTVLQEGYIFNDTIARNIAVGDERADYSELLSACRIANVLPFIESLPSGFNTMLGTDGMGISMGQKQRILIARAIYKKPTYFFLDEATNALDANNERVIVENLKEVFKGRTVVVIAHRLSTVQNADNIIVLDNGRIAETGTHQSLCETRGKYYELVKNQLELGN